MVVTDAELGDFDFFHDLFLKKSCCIGGGKLFYGLLINSASAQFGQDDTVYDIESVRSVLPVIGILHDRIVTADVVVADQYPVGKSCFDELQNKFAVVRMYPVNGNITSPFQEFKRVLNVVGVTDVTDDRFSGATLFPATNF